MLTLANFAGQDLLPSGAFSKFLRVNSTSPLKYYYLIWSPLHQIEINTVVILVNKILNIYWAWIFELVFTRNLKHVRWTLNAAERSTYLNKTL